LKNNNKTHFFALTLGVKSDNIMDADSAIYDSEVNLQNVPDKTETRLVEATFDGDIDSFGKLCQRYYAALVAIGYSVLADHQLAEDAAQESFAQALVNLRKLRDKKRFVPWLAAICRNVAKDMVAIKVRQVSSKDLSQAARNNNHDESRRLIRRAIEQLPVSAKELIVLRYYNGLSYEEIGSVLGISKATINGRITRAKRKMAKYLRRNGFPENRL
jgi:RNA polymerase sigma-70 factor (ECF subfamily)